MGRTRTVLLLHGLGATAAVWAGLRALLAQRGLTSVIAPDLGGHGRSAWRSHYSVGSLAAELADSVRAESTVESDLLIVGHSLGVYIALALASGWFGLKVQGILGLGPKVEWSRDELANALELAARPVRHYATRAEALARYRRISGLDLTIAPDDTSLADGIVECAQGWRLAQDPRTFEVAGAPFATLAASAVARIVLARGSDDPMVPLAQLRAHDPDAAEIAGAGHNAHVEKPQALVALLERLL
jgi:pimeloyl-ACP methyl ester carboxylesterase